VFFSLFHNANAPIQSETNPVTDTNSTIVDLDAPNLDAKTRKRLADCIAISKNRNTPPVATQVAVAAPANTDVEVGTPDQISRVRRRAGTPAPKIIAEAQDRLDLLLRERGMDPFPLFPASEYPTPLTRLPLFPPVKKCTARQTAASGDWVPLTSRWDGGGVFKYGPALTVFDEDTLFGLMTLRQQGIKGPADRMPLIAPPSHGKNGLAPSNPVKVHALYCLVSQLENAVKGYTPDNGWGGRTLAKRRDSIDTLSRVMLKFVRPKGADAFHGQPIQLLFVEFVVTPTDACYYVQFHPVLSHWLEEYRTYIDFNIRRQLSPLGKAMHRALASQRSNGTFDVPLADFFESIGASGALADRKREAATQLEKLCDLNFLACYSFTGTGRRVPSRLRVTFAKRSA
jgi:hypothetical protein